MDEELQEFCTLWEQEADTISANELTPERAQKLRDDFEYAVRIFEITKTPTVFQRNRARDSLNALKVKVEIAITQAEAIYRERERPYQGKKLDIINSSLQVIIEGLKKIK